MKRISGALCTPEHKIANGEVRVLKMSIKPQWVLVKDDASRPLPRLLELLCAIDEARSINAAAARLGLSYRHAWGLLRRAGREFGAPLVDMKRGRRATLSALGERLAGAERRISARIAPLLDSLASELEAEVERSRSGALHVPRIHASHGYAIELLRQFLAARHVPIELRYRGSMESLASLASGACDVAAFHIPVGELQPAALKHYMKWLDPQRQVLIGLCTRRLGLMTAAGNPKRVEALGDLATPGVRFVNRAFGSGTRIVLDLLLENEQVDSRSIAGYESGELTHSAVAACVASGLADAAFGVETGARQFGLYFIPILSERYFLVCERASLRTPTVKRIREILASKQYRAAAGGLAGVDVTGAGAVLAITEAFPASVPDRAPGNRAEALHV
jgi:molybdate transport repressor ModE-like protein